MANTWRPASSSASWPDATLKGSPHDDLLPGQATLTVARWACVIRNVVVRRLPTSPVIPVSGDRCCAASGGPRIAALRFPGRMNAGSDLGLRDGGWTFAITNDWRDADADQEHNLLRR